MTHYLRVAFDIFYLRARPIVPRGTRRPVAGAPSQYLQLPVPEPWELPIARPRLFRQDVG